MNQLCGGGPLSEWGDRDRGGSKIDGRGVLVLLASHGLRACARQLGESGGMPPQEENFGFQEF